MKWGRKKPSSSASSYFSRPSLISNVLPASWLTKFKRMSTNSSGQDNVTEPKPNGKSNSVYTGPSWCANGGGREGEAGEEGVNGGDDDDDDAFWRLSFREEAVGGSNGNGSVLRSVWYHNHCEHQDQLNLHRPSPSCQRFSDAREEEEVVPKFCDMVSQLRQTRGLPRRVEVSTAEESVGEKVVEIRTPRLRVENVKKLRRRNQRGNSGDQKLLENVAWDKPRKEVTGDGKVKREDYNLVRSDARTSMDGCLWDEGEEGEVIRRRKDEEPCGGETNPEWKKMKEMKIEEIRQRKTLYISREVVEKQRPKHKAIKVKSCSPRLAAKAETCRIRALEEMKRARLKSMKRREKRNEGSTLGLDSFAVVKTSLDPQKDFRDSMMEMIKEQGISRPEELEDLLVCYLTLNCDEYHELIIKVFRQVWFDMNQTCKFSELENEKVLL